MVLDSGDCSAEHSGSSDGWDFGEADTLKSVGVLVVDDAELG